MSATRVVLPRLAEFGGDPTGADESGSSQHHLQRLSTGSSSVTPNLIKRVARCQITRPPKMVTESITNLTKTNSLLDLALSGIPKEKNLQLPKIDEDSLKQTEYEQSAPSPLPSLLRSKHRITTSSLFPEPPPITLTNTGSILNLNLAIEGQDIRLPPPRTPTESRKTDGTKKPRQLTTPVQIKSSSDNLQNGVLSFEENIRKLLQCQSLGVPIESKYQASGNIATPVFHCPRCLKHWAMYNVTPHGCKQTAKPTKGPSFYITNTGHRLLKTFQAMPKDHQHLFLDKIGAIEPDGKGIIHVPSVEYLAIAMAKRSSETLHGKRAEIIGKKNIDQVSPSISIIGGWDTSEPPECGMTSNQLSNRMNEPPFEQGPMFLRIHDRPVASALCNASGGKLGNTSELSKMAYDERPRTSIGQTSHVTDQKKMISDDNLLQHELHKNVKDVSSRVNEKLEIDGVTGQFAPDGTYYTGIYAHDGQFIPNGRISPNGKRQSGLLGPDGRFYVNACYGQDGTFYGRESQAYNIGFTFMNAHMQSNIQSIDYVTFDKPQQGSIGKCVDESKQQSTQSHKHIEQVISDGKSPDQLNQTSDYKSLNNKKYQKSDTDSNRNDCIVQSVLEVKSTETSTHLKNNTGLILTDGRNQFNSNITPGYSKNVDSEIKQTSTNVTEKGNGIMSASHEYQQLEDKAQCNVQHKDPIKENEHRSNEKDERNINDRAFSDKERYTYSDESFDSLFAEDSIADDDSEAGGIRNRQIFVEEQNTVPKETVSLTETKQSVQGKTKQELNPRHKQRRESAFNYMGVKDNPTTTTDSQESLNNSRNKAKENKKKIIKNKAVKNVTGKPDTKPGFFQKHMFATPEESLAKTSAVVGASGKRKGTKVNQKSELTQVNSTSTVATTKVPARSREGSSTNITEIRTTIKSPLMSVPDKKSSKKHPSIFKPESDIGITDRVLTERTVSSATETKRGTLPALPGIQTNQPANENETPQRKRREIIKKVAKSKRKTVGESKTTETKSREGIESNVLHDEERSDLKPRLSNEPPERTQSSDMNIVFQSDLLPKLVQENTSTPSHRMTYSTLPSTFGQLPKPLMLATSSKQNINSTGDFDILCDANKLFEIATEVENKKQTTELPFKSPTSKLKGFGSNMSLRTLSATSSQESVFESVSQIWRKHDDELIRLREIENHGGISILNFTPAFRFSLFDIPYQYVENNNRLIERFKKLRYLKQPKKSRRKVVKKLNLLTEPQAVKL